VNERISVEAYAGAFYPERPISFVRKGQKFVVVDVVKQWRTPDEIHFYVIADDGSGHEVAYSFSRDKWQVIAR